jgi:hypothetical protein
MGEIGGEPSWEYAEKFASEEGEVVGDDGMVLEIDGDGE